MNAERKQKITEYYQSLAQNLLSKSILRELLDEVDRLEQRDADAAAIIANQTEIANAAYRWRHTIDVNGWPSDIALTADHRDALIAAIDSVYTPPTTNHTPATALEAVTRARAVLDHYEAQVRLKAAGVEPVAQGQDDDA